jgi:AcrR family transcriptional regulator
MLRRRIKADVPTEEKIKEAARKLFTEKGFDAVKTRDIAEEAGINQALLNYYFRSKEKLFDIVMIENFEQFVKQLIPVMGDEALSFDDILEKVTGSYIDMLKHNPDLPFFIINQMRSESSKLLEIRERMVGVRSIFIKRLEDGRLKKKMSPANNAHMMMNFMGLIIFPFVAQSILMKVNGLSKKEFNELMDERKKLVPMWLKEIMPHT